MIDLPVPPHRLEDLFWADLLPMAAVLVAAALAAAAGRAVPIKQDDPLTPEDESRGQGLRRLLRALVQIAAFMGALVAAVLTDRALHGDPRGLDMLSRFGGLVAALWAGFLAVDWASRHLRERFHRLGRSAAASVVPLLRKISKAGWALLACMVFLDNLGLDLKALLAGLGVGGLAIALAGQKTIENLFGGLVLVLDQPVRVGDFCRFGDKMGTVEDVGLRSIKIRTPDRTLITVPNGEFSQLQLENFARRDRIRFSTAIGLRYDTPAKALRALLKALQAHLDKHPHLDRKLPHRVNFTGLGASSLDLELFCYFKTADFEEYLLWREQLLLEVMDHVAKAGAALALPTHAQVEEPRSRRKPG